MNEMTATLSTRGLAFCLIAVCVLAVLHLIFNMRSTEISPFLHAPSINKQELKVLSYNIDGLNSHKTIFRTNFIINMILSESPDIIHLQEVIPETYAVLKSALEVNGYICSSSISDLFAHYFTMSAVKRSRFQRVQFSMEDFQGNAVSLQGRILLKTHAVLDGQWECLFLNCHLESTGDAFESIESKTRMAQLQTGLDYIIQEGRKGVCVLSGDLNLREEEAIYVLDHYNGDSKIHDAAVEVAEKLKQSPSPTFYRPRNPKDTRRYDRTYYGHFVYDGMNNPENKKENSNLQISPSSVYLKGDDIILSEPASYLTPSDHRALIAVFSLSEL